MKYWQQPGSGVHLYILPAVRAILSNPDIDIAVTEGEKKAACLTQFKIPDDQVSAASTGFWGDGNGGLHSEFDPVAFIDRNVLIVFDSDTWVKRRTFSVHCTRWAEGIEKRGGRVEALIIPPASDR